MQPLPLPADDLAHAFAVVTEGSWRALAGKRLFMSGGTGFVGKWMLATLIDANARLSLGARIAVLSRAPEAFAAAFPALANAPGVELVGGDVRNFVFPDSPVDVVIHAATDVVARNSPRDVFATCVEGTARVLELAAHRRAADLLLVSSGAVYGRQPPSLARLHESWTGAPDPLLPASAYGEGKRASEWLACAHAAESSLRVKIARCFTFVGPYLPLDRHFAVGNFLGDALAGREIVIRGDGTPRRSYLHAADMAGWLWATLLRGRSCRAYNIGSDDAVSISDLARGVATAVGAVPIAKPLEDTAIDQSAERYVPDVARARAELGLPDPIPFHEALARTARWYQTKRDGRDTTSASATGVPASTEAKCA